jgi:multidrug resistance protein, MATE family
MRVREHIGRTVKLAMPVAASQVSDMLVWTADSIMVGALGAVPLAAVALAGASTSIPLLFSVGYTAAMTPLIGHAVGSGDWEGAGRFARAGARVSLIACAAIIFILLALSPWLTTILGTSEQVGTLAIPYFRWLALSFIFRIAFGLFKQTAEALHDTRSAMIMNVGSNIVNVFFNWVFIYGNLGMPEMGVEGAGFATFLARVAAAGAAYLVFIRSDLFAPLRTVLQRQMSTVLDRRSIVRIIKDGTGIGLQIIVEVLGFAFGAIMIGWIGATELAAHNISINPASITFIVALGLSSAATIRVSRARGAGDLQGARNAAIAAFAIVLIYMILVACFYVLVRYELPKVYVSDAAVIGIASTLLLWAAAFSIFDGLQVVGLGILRGYGDIRVPTLWAAVSYLVITIPAGYLAAFTFGMGPAGIWLGYLLGLIVASTAYVFRILKIFRHPELAAPRTEEVDPLLS